MDHGRITSAAKFAALAAFAAFVASCVVWFLSLHSGGAAAVDDGDVPSVRLAGRTVFAPDPAAGRQSFPSAPPPSTSRRGTASFVLVAKGRVTADMRSRAARCGARVTGVIPPYGMVVEADASALARLRKDGAFACAEPLAAQDRISASLRRELEIGASGSLRVKVVPLCGDDAAVIAGHLAGLGVKPYEVSQRGRGRVCAEVPAGMVAGLASRGDVRWVERHARPRLLNDVASGLINAAPVRDVHGLTGSGQTITISDSGLDTGDLATIRDDFKGRVSFIGTVDGCQPYDTTGHGTHVAGSLAGDGALSGGMFKGVAYGASLNVWQCYDASGNLYFPEDDQLFQPDRANSSSYIHSGSWGGGSGGEYDSMSIEIDDWMWRHAENLAVFACGNSGGARSVLSPAGAKNVVAAGATESQRSKTDNPSAMASFSSKGPMADGRIKPDICAPGKMIVSTRSARKTGTYARGTYDENYAYDSGTSMATPFVAGSAALVRQWLMERRGYTNEMPTAALLKAVLTGGAHDMSADSGASCGGAAPNSSQGWGRIDLGESLYPTNAAVRLVDRIPFSDGERFTLRVTTTNAAPLSVQLVWTDHPGEYGAAQALVNDLDLIVSNETTGAVWRGNGVPGGDRTNNVESVRITSAPPATYAIAVVGEHVPYDCMEGGAAALYVRGAFGEDSASGAAETVRLAVSADCDAPGLMVPAAGERRITKGVPVALSADDIEVCRHGSSLVTQRRQVAGWTGSGDVPPSGSSGRVIVRLEQDSGIIWRWNAFTNALLRSYLLIPSYGNFYYDYEDAWPKLGETVALALPESAPHGSETVDLSAEGWRYADDDGTQKPLTVQRLGRIEIAESDAESGAAVTDAEGHMPTEFTVSMNDSKDLLYYYYDVASTNAATALPMWWYQRYVAQDPSADVVRFTSVSPSRLEWVGGAGHVRVLERTPALGPGEDWRPVYTNAPAPVLTNSWNVPAAFSTNSFYRIR